MQIIFSSDAVCIVFLFVPPGFSKTTLQDSLTVVSGLRGLSNQLFSLQQRANFIYTYIFIFFARKT